MTDFKFLHLLRSFLWASVPIALQPKFFAELSKHNFRYAVTLAITLGIIHIGLIWLNFSQRFQNGVWQNDGYERLAYLHFTLEGVLAGLLLTALFGRPLSPTAQYHWALIFSGFMMMWCAALSASDQEIHGQITVYIVAIFGLAVAQYYPIGPSLAIYGLAHLILLLGISHFQRDAETASAHYVNSTASVTLAFLLSRLVYGNFVREFTLREKEKELLQELSSQAKHLAAEKQRSDRLLRELGEANWELALANESLQRTSALRAELMEIAAHDLKNPLQAIVGFSYLIADSRSIEDIKEHNKVIYRNAERMFNIIADLLERNNAENAEEKAQHLECSLTNLSVLMQQTITQFEQQAKLKEQTLIVQIEPGCYAHVNSALIKSALENLISNAIKYSQESARIWIEVCKKDVPDTSSSQSAERTGEWIRIAVKDEGQGLSEEDMKRLFGRFQRLSAVPTGGESSTGLGLYITRQVVKRHGGRIWAESEGKGKGSAFFIELPASLENAGGKGSSS
jgi:signal transduction histidine kinase